MPKIKYDSDLVLIKTNEKVNHGDPEFDITYILENIYKIFDELLVVLENNESMLDF